MGNIISIIRGEGSPYYGDYNDMVYPNLVGKDVEYEYDPNGNFDQLGQQNFLDDL